MEVHREWSSWRRGVEPWYLAYALLGATTAGLVPILLPLTVSRAHNATQVGLVMATVSLGGLTAPLWDGLADQHRLHRWLLAGGLLVTAIGLGAFAFTTAPVVWLGFALLQGIGAAAAATVANLFIVEVHPQVEWDARIGWLQTFCRSRHRSGARAGSPRARRAPNSLRRPGLAPLGSTGEFVYLMFAQRGEMVRIVVDAAARNTVEPALARARAILCKAEVPAGTWRRGSSIPSRGATQRRRS